MTIEKCRSRSWLDPEVRQCPYQFYNEMRPEGVYYDEGMKAYVVLSYDLLRRVLADTETYKNRSPEGSSVSIIDKTVINRALNEKGYGPDIPIMADNDPPAS